MGRPGDIGRNMGNDKNTEMGKQARKIETKNSRQRKTWGETERQQETRTGGHGHGAGVEGQGEKIGRSAGNLTLARASRPPSHPPLLG